MLGVAVAGARAVAMKLPFVDDLAKRGRIPKPASLGRRLQGSVAAPQLLQKPCRVD